MFDFELEKSIFLRIPKIQLFAAKINIISTLGSLRTITEDLCVLKEDRKVVEM